MTLYGEREGAVRPILQVAMPRLPRIYAPGGRSQHLTHEAGLRKKQTNQLVGGIR